MKLILYTNYYKVGTISQHSIEISATYYSINKSELYIYRKNKGFYRLDINKIHLISIPTGGYFNYIELNSGKPCGILPAETTKDELLKLLRLGGGEYENN